MELKGRKDSFVVMVGDFNTLLSIMDIALDRSKEVEDVNNTIPSRSNRYIQNSLPHNNSIYILLKYTTDIFHNRPYVS